MGRDPGTTVVWKAEDETTTKSGGVGVTVRATPRRFPAGQAIAKRAEADPSIR